MPGARCYIPDMPPRRRRNLSRFRAMVLAVVGGVQVPGVTAIAHWLGSWPIAVGGAALISIPYLVGLRRPFEDRPKGWLYLYGGLWPFFAWWSACLAFAVLAPLALALGWLVPWLTMDRGLGAAALLAIAAGLRATDGRLRVVKREIGIGGLPPELDGYRIAHLSDVHCGSYTPARRVEAWVARINALDVDLVAVTGDLITSGDAHVDAVARALAGLRGRDGVFACMGNHDYFTDGEELAAALERQGLTVLRNRGQTLTRGAARLHVAGVDDTWTRRDDVARALADRPAGVPTVLLAHDPNLFPQAVAAGVELTLSGHTHGGQLAVPWLSRRFNLARLVTRFTAGLYRDGDATLYVNVGAGTTGPPIRLGTRSEIALLTLRARREKGLDGATDQI
jgi:predicted MPP superfamily phosphohydrolase